MQTQQLIIFAVIFAAAVEIFRAGQLLRWLVLLAVMRIERVDLGALECDNPESQAKRLRKWKKLLRINRLILSGTKCSKGVCCRPWVSFQSSAK
jgi:hypothetical protein